MYTCTYTWAPFWTTDRTTQLTLDLYSKKGINEFTSRRNSNRSASVQSYWNCSTEPLWSPLSPSTVLPSLAARGREHSLATLSKTTNTASRRVGAPVTGLQSHLEARAVKRLRVILADPAHPVQGTRRTDHSVSNTYKVPKNAIYWDKTQHANFRGNPLYQDPNT